MKKWMLALIGALLLCPALAAQGLILESETSSGQKVQKGVMYLLGEKLRFDTLGVDGRPEASMIFDGPGEVMYMVNHREHSYVRMDRETMSGMAAQMNQAMEQMKRQLAGMPPEQRRMVEEMMKRNMPQAPAPAHVEVRAAGGRRDIGGFPCREYEVLENGSKAGEIWVTDWSRFGAGPEAFALFGRLGKFMEGLTADFGRAASVPMERRFFSGMEDLHGAPVLVVHLEDGQEKSRTQLMPRAAEKPTEELFEVPAYTEQRLPGRP